MKRGRCALACRRFLFELGIPLPTSFSAVAIWKAAASALPIVLLCAGCMWSPGWRRTCNTCKGMAHQCGQCVPQDDDAGGVWEKPALRWCRECCHWDADKCKSRLEAAKCYCLGCCCNTWRRVEPVACWPYKKCQRVVNFCVPNDVCGPCRSSGPGLFHPVPTRPVFGPGPAPFEYPAELPKTISAP
jgi:hypothetical protein